MELLEDNHRVELRVYQQKVKHLEYEHKNSIKTIIQDGTGLLNTEQTTHEDRERELLRVKEQLKFEQMELELINSNKVNEIRLQHEKQLIKLRSQFDDGMLELKKRCEIRLNLLDTDLELRRRVEVHEVEERKNQHINDLIKNHNKAFIQMKSYYNDITRTNLNMIKKLQNQVEILKERSVNNKKLLTEYIIDNQKLSKPLSEVSNTIAILNNDLKERNKDLMALKNANSRLSAITKSSALIKTKLSLLETEYNKIEKERDVLYSSFEESIQKVKQQSEFTNQALEQRLIASEHNISKATIQVNEIITAANLDSNEVSSMMTALNQMLAVKEETLRNTKFNVIKLQKMYNDNIDIYTAKMVELGIPEAEMTSLGCFIKEDLPIGSTTAPALSLISRP